jgi:dihydroorotate dehydrogenase (fumarate)
MSADLRTRYLGLELRSPIVASAAPANGDLAHAVRLEEAGVGAIVLPSLFEDEVVHEQVGLSAALDHGTGQFAEASGYFPHIDRISDASERYATAITRLKARVQVPIIGSLNASTSLGWVRYARLIEDAGADALELNLYRVACDPERSAASVEQADLDVIAAVRDAVAIPIAVKLAPYYTSLARFADGALRAGADGLVLFNRFYQPDVDPETLEVVPRIDLSTPAELRLPVRWVALLRAGVAREAWLAASSGVHSGGDMVKALAVGADVVMMTSAILRSGPAHVAEVESELRQWLDDREYRSVAELRGSAVTGTSLDRPGIERANYVATLRSWTTPAWLTPGGSS